MRKTAHNKTAALFLGLLSCLPVSSLRGQIPPSLPAGQVIEKVSCRGDSSQSYALYLPSGYSASKVWPIVYLFDPGGRGQRPVAMYKDAAEKYGFILAASNNSRNFGSDQTTAVNALWEDTHSRLALDPRRTYTGGFSGGARVAGSLPVACPQCQIAGVIAHGAGYPNNRGPAKDGLLYFLAVGDQDFNWPEVTAVAREREEQGLSYQLRVFSGSHQWAPANVVEEALEWLTLKSMQAGSLAPDPAFIDRMLEGIKANLEEGRKRKDALAQLAALRALVSDFRGFRDESAYEQTLAALKKSGDLKSALRKEQEAATDQRMLEAGISSKLSAYIQGTADDPIMLQREIAQSMAHLQDQAAHDKNDVRRLIARRAFDGVWVGGIESGQQEFQQRHYQKAESCFRLMSSVRDDPWPLLLLAETHTAMRNYKEAVKDLREGVHRGLKGPTVIESDDELQPLRSEPEFQKLLQELRLAK